MSINSFKSYPTKYYSYKMFGTLKPRNQDKFDELIAYLTKHKKAIINYHKRKECGKTIGLGRAEKGIDLIVAQR
jgi:hypothetical protein